METPSSIVSHLDPAEFKGTALYLIAVSSSSMPPILAITRSADAQVKVIDGKSTEILAQKGGYTLPCTEVCQSLRSNQQVRTAIYCNSRPCSHGHIFLIQ